MKKCIELCWRNTLLPADFGDWLVGVSHSTSFLRNYSIAILITNKSAHSTNILYFDIGFREMITLFVQNLIKIHHFSKGKSGGGVGCMQYTPSVSTIILSGRTYSSQNVWQIWESTLSKSDYLVGHRGRTWEWIFKDFFYISWGEHVKHFVIDAYL